MAFSQLEYPRQIGSVTTSMKSKSVRSCTQVVRQEMENRCRPCAEPRAWRLGGEEWQSISPRIGLGKQDLISFCAINNLAIINTFPQAVMAAPRHQNVL